MKYFICSDVHSFYDEWMDALDRAGFDINNPSHVIIHCGDLLDRGSKPKECLQFVCDLIDKDRIICIRGNHEDLLEEIFERGYYQGHDLHNGTIKTVETLCSFEEVYMHTDAEIINDVRKNELLNKYTAACKDYVEIGDDIFVHGWLPCDYDYENNKLFIIDNWRDTIWRDDWTSARWLNGMYQWHSGAKIEGKTIWCGHWHASYGNSKFHHDGLEFIDDDKRWIDPVTGNIEPHVNHTAFKDDGIVALDACTVISGFVNVEVIER